MIFYYWNEQYCKNQWCWTTLDWFIYNIVSYIVQFWPLTYLVTLCSTLFYSDSMSNSRWFLCWEIALVLNAFIDNLSNQVTPWRISNQGGLKKSKEGPAIIWVKFVYYVKMYLDSHMHYPCIIIIVQCILFKWWIR